LLNRHGVKGLTISHAALGEIYITIKNSFDKGEDFPGNDTICNGFYDFINSKKLFVCGLPTDFSIVKNLMDCDIELKPADALILASAISCPKCKILYTIDRTLLTSTAIKEESDDLRKKMELPRLKILELPKEK
jgi:hypothetical protein